MRVVVLGVTGLIGRHLARTVPIDVDIIGASRRPPNRSQANRWERVDICEESSVASLLHRTSPDVVIHAAGEARVDAAKGDPLGARRSIIEGTRIVIEVASHANARLLYISSNAVYAGADAPYSLSTPRLPANEYGRLKIEAENLCLAAKDFCSIARPLLTYGWSGDGQRKSVVESWISKLSQGQPIQALTDVSNQPLFAEDCARTLWNLALSDAMQIANIGGPVEVDMFQLANSVADVFGFDHDLIHPSTCQELGLPEHRPTRVAYTDSILSVNESLTPREGLEWMKRTSIV